MAAGRQLRLLLWKDYLIRKRKLITLAGVLWATMVMMCLYVVRINVDDQNFPTCQFPARALPSAGMLPFVQSFVCSVDNDCKPLDQFQEIPTYENSKLTQLQRRFSPLLQNETVLAAAGTVPGAIKLLATFADVLDDPAMVDISKDGLRVGALFTNPGRVKRFIADELNVSAGAADSLMEAKLALTAMFNGNLDRCNAASLSNLLQVENQEHLAEITQRLCDLSDDELQKMAGGLLTEIDFSKYLTMISSMYYKVSGDSRVPRLAAMAAAALQLLRLENYLPRAASVLLLNKDTDFSYFDPTWISRLVDQLGPSFFGTKTFTTLRDLADMVTTALQYLDKAFAGQPGDVVRQATGLALAQVSGADGLERMQAAFNNAADLIEQATRDNAAIDVFKIMAEIINMINKFLPDQTRHEVLLYSTLLAKLVEGAHRVVTINLDIQDMAYQVSLRNPAGVRVLVELPATVMRKGLEGLADAERVQIMTSKLNAKGQIFCDSGKLAAFFMVSQSEADVLKAKLCTDAWKNYIEDFIHSFGIYDVKDIINNMASLVIQETFGKDISDQLYTIEQDFDILKNFTRTLVAMKSQPQVPADWNTLFNVTDDSEFKKVFSESGHLGKQILITVHGALAKEVVKQNGILNFKITPILLDLTDIVIAVRDQLALTPPETTGRVKEMYPAVVQTMLVTLMNEDKTYKALSTASSQVFCNGSAAASAYLELPAEGADQLLAALCDATQAIDRGLQGDSKIAEAIANVKKSAHSPFDDVDWTALIDGLKQVYVKLDAEYPYLFQFTSYGMDGGAQEKVQALMEEAKEFWFNLKRVDRTLHLSIKIIFRVLDVADRAAFALQGAGWLQLKHAVHAAAKPLALVDDFVQLLAGVAHGASPPARLPPLTSQALTGALANLPQLVVDAVDIIVNQNVELEPIISLMNAEPAWPCSNESIAELVPLSDQGDDAVRAIEDLMCLNSGVRAEWIELIKEKNISFYNATTWNTTTFAPHLFLTFSSTFDALVQDTLLVKDLLQELVNGTQMRGDQLTIVGAWKYAADAFEGRDRNDTLRKLFSNIDTLLDSLSTAPSAKSTSALWEQYAGCQGAAPGRECLALWRAAWKASLKALSVVVRDAAGDLLNYFTEINEPDASVLQLLGFTRGSGLFTLYDKLPELVATLLNSYFDYGFMSQVRRAAVTDFWDCDAVVLALAPAVGSGVDSETIRLVRPYVCPSLLYWLSLPRGANTFLDIVAKPQYTLFTLPAENLTSNFAIAFNKTMELSYVLSTTANNTQPPIIEEDTKLATLQDKLKKTVDTVLNYRIDVNYPSYRLFNDVNKKQFMAATYLTRVTAMVNKIAVAIDQLKPQDIDSNFNEDEAKKIESEISTISRIYKRRPQEAIALHFDLVTDILSSNSANSDLVSALENMCEAFRNNDSSRDILNDGERTKNQICSKQYKEIYGAVQNVVDDDYEPAKRSLVALVNALQDDDDEVPDVVEFFSDRKKLINTLKSSIKYSYELGLPIYLQYLQNNLQNYNVVLSFLAGGDWWAELRRLYSGPYIGAFFDVVEDSLEIAESILTKPDEIHLVRLLRDVNVNDSSLFCRAQVSLAEYAGARLARLQALACARGAALREIPALVFASQGYNDDLRLSKEINYTALYSDISTTESRLEAIREGPKAPERPAWVTDERIRSLRQAATNLLSKEMLTRMSFGVLTNVVDAATLFLNSTQCEYCSHFTAFFKQLNLQLYKKQEYDSLMCGVERMAEDAVHLALRNDFHWDMAFRELVSFRNFTKFELNKALNELLGQVKLHLLEDAPRGKLAACLTPTAADTPAGDAALLLKVISHTMTLVEAELPHLHEVAGMTQVPFLRSLQAQVAPSLDVYLPLAGYWTNETSLRRQLLEFVAEEYVTQIMDGYVNLRVVDKPEDAESVPVFIRTGPAGGQWRDVCAAYDCGRIAATLRRHLDASRVAHDLPKAQEAEFWKFVPIRSVLYRVRRVVWFLARLVELASRLDVRGALRGDLAPALDLLMEATTQDSINVIYSSITGSLRELEGLLQNSSLHQDLTSFSEGLWFLKQYWDEIAAADVKIPVAQLFPHGERLEAALSSQGLNNTNFWSLAAPGLLRGRILLTPIFSWKSGDHIGDYVCQPEAMARVLEVGEQGSVSAEDVYGAVGEQLCGLSDRRAKRLALTLLGHVNYSYVVDQVTAFILPKLYSTSNLTLAEGSSVMSGLPLMAAVLPGLQEQVGVAADSFSGEPLFRSLANFSSVGGLLGSSDFLARAGHMVCGKPFVASVPRLFRSVLESEDHADQPDQRQLEGLPTEFCRSLYKDIISAQGGKIVWSFVKPLIMGRILYTPADPVVEDIIHRANSSFAHMARLASLVHAFSDSFPAVDLLSSHRQGIGVLSRLLSAPAFKDLRGMLVTGDVPSVDLEGVLDDFGDMSGIGSILSKVSSLLRCINLDRFHPAATEQDLAHEAARLTMANEFSAGLVFLNSAQQAGRLTDLQYKIRMDIENTPTTSRMKNFLWIPGPEANFLENMRYFRGFVQLQDLVNRAIVSAAGDLGASRRKRETPPAGDWAVYTQQMPYPCYKKDFFQTSLYESQALIVCFFFSLLFTVAAAVRFIVADHESGNTMLMHVMGVKLSIHTFSWFLCCCLEMLLTCVCVTLVLKAGAILPRSDFSLLLALVATFGLAVLCFCYMISKLFSKASFAAVCAAIAYLVSFMPVVLILSLEAVISKAAKIVICLSMSSSFCYAFLHITRLEATGTGAQWSAVWDVGDATDVSVGLAAAMMLADAAVYVAVGWLIDRYTGLKTLQSSITYCTTSDEKAGVSVLNVSKAYGPRRALHNVCLELHRGQLTALLGHNGAGKTTLINILTGMLKPTKGHVIIRSERSTGTVLGVCPQRDVLFDHMTAREHVALYAQLKTGKTLEEVKDEVDSMLRVLSLGAVSEVPVGRLSGGTRRRLCVSLAFVGAPHLVTLDEPTSGVDPAARREIWSMIARLKEERTILLTTHHLDEADLLSDQIVIMHKGQVHTTGSPIEIKRTLGNGYKLTVSYPDDWSSDSMQERTKALLTLVREVVKNASLADVSGLNVDVVLPFFDANGLNNDFLRLCEVLEGSEQALGFRSFALECSSLEQVFYNVCHQPDQPDQPDPIQYESHEDIPSKSTSTASIRTEGAPLVPAAGPLTGGRAQQFLQLMRARGLHYCRNRWLLFVVLVLPSLFVGIAMGFSTIRPPADNEVALKLYPGLYPNTTQFIIPQPSVLSKQIDPTFARHVMDHLMFGKSFKNWTADDTPSCSCDDAMQVCNVTNAGLRKPDVMILPDVDALNQWLVNTQKEFIEKRYVGYSSSLANNATALIAWYNNKGHHALPAAVGALHSAALRAATGRGDAAITTYSHPMKISEEQISKDTVYQHVADAGISGLVVLAYSLASAGAAVLLVGARVRQETRLLLLSGVRPALYWAAALAADLVVIVINMAITAILMEAFHFPVFVERNNLPAICLLILLYGFACGCLVHVAEKLFSEPSVANMLLFCGNAFLGLGGITVLLILDIISDSERTDNVRWVLHKIFMLSPQFALGDGLLEIAKSTIQAQVLSRFGMDTYKDPLASDLVVYHFLYLLLVGSFLFCLNLAIEYQCFDFLLTKFRPESMPPCGDEEPESPDVRAERERVSASVAPGRDRPLRLRTIGNINAGYVATEDEKVPREHGAPQCDVAACAGLGKRYGRRAALAGLTLGLPRGQCTALLGENGAGKSTTFSLLTGQLRPTTGSIYLGDQRLSATQLCKGHISYCPQSDAIDPLLTVRETLDIYCRLRGIGDEEEVIKRTMEMFELVRYSDTRAGALSGGNKRKLCTAIAFMSRSSLILLDEPTSGMDPGSRGCVALGVRAALSAGRGALVSTHALRDARALAARVALLRAGRLRALAPLDDCLTRFGGGYVVECRVPAGGAGAAWAAVASRAPHAALQVLHRAALHFLLPSHATVNEKEVRTRLSDIFRLMAELQGACDIDDYTVTQTSLEQMFLSFSSNGGALNLESSPPADELTTITAL